MRKYLLPLLLAMLLCLSASAAPTADIRGYDAQAGYTAVTLGSYPTQEDGAKAPILWRVLEVKDGVAYLLSNAILDVSRIHNKAQGYPGWDKADLNAWLQKDFIEKAFTAEEAAALTASEHGIASLPSYDDLKKAEYGFPDNMSRRALGTPWADSEGLFWYRHKHHSPYWTRTISDRTFAHRSIKLEGNLGYLGVTAHDMGVRPVVWLALDKVDIASGSGALEDPFALTPKAPAQ